MDKYEKEIKKFGMLHEYHDSKEYLLQNLYLVCEDTANYLTLWCVNLEVEEVRLVLSMFCLRKVAQFGTVFLLLIQCYYRRKPKLN